MNALVPIQPPVARTRVTAAPARFDPVSMTLHWATVLMIIALFASAWSIGLAQDREAAARALTLHRSLGATMWLLAFARVAWRLLWAVRPPLPKATPWPQQAAALGVEAALYAILLVQPLTGLAQSVARGRPFDLFVLRVPVLMARDRPLAGLLHEVHETTAKVLLALIALHVAAALFHGLMRRDGVLASMWPRAAGPRPETSPPKTPGTRR